MEYIPSFRDDLYADIQPSYNDSLAHHGIKGMHWGVRRFQNPDGSLTSAGKNHYSRNPIKRQFQKRAEKKEAERKAAEQQAAKNREFHKKLDNLENRAMKIDADEWLKENEKYQPKSWSAYEKAYDKADYYNDPAKYQHVHDLAYKAGYDTGKHTGNILAKKYGNDALNRYLDLHLHEDTYYRRMTESDFKTLESRDSVERFAKMCGENEANQI